MVKAYLSYNPYLVETEIQFNGQKPRINSLVEKYQKEKLQSWIRKLPQIFHDEMNGYGFELLFSGTSLDFEELKKAFKDAGVENMVKVILEERIGDRKEKLKLLNDLLQWLDTNENSHFNKEKFLLENDRVFDESYSFIIMQGRGFDTSRLLDMGISVEEVDSTQELKDTDLTNTPILICVDRSTLPGLQETIRYFTKRKKEKKDVIPEQVFFYIHPSVNKDNVKRIICDLDVQNPKIVEDAQDQQILRYIELYPVTDHIAGAVKLLRQQINKMQGVFTEEEEASLKSNADVPKKLDIANTELKLLKLTKETFEKNIELQIPDDWQNYKDELIDGILNWKKNKTKTTRRDEATVMANMFDKEIKRLYEAYERKLSESLFKMKEATDIHYSQLYECAKADSDFKPTLSNLQQISSEELPVYISGLMDQKEEKYVPSTNDFDIMGIFFKPSKQELVLETSYYYQKWREYIKIQVEPVARRLLEKSFAAFRTYCIEAREIYRDHLEELISLKKEAIEKTKKNLSAEEMKVQADIVWLQELKEQVTAIEEDWQKDNTLTETEMNGID